MTMNNPFGGKTYEHLTEPADQTGRRSMQSAIEENERLMRAIGIDGDDELAQAMQSLRGRPILHMIATLVCRVEKLEKIVARKGEDQNDATDR